MNEIAQAYLASILNQNTRRAYRRDLISVHEHGSGLLDPNSNFNDVKSYFASLRADKLKATTLQRRKSVLLRYFRWATDKHNVDFSIRTAQLKNIVPSDYAFSSFTRSEAPDFLSAQRFSKVLKSAEASSWPERDVALIHVIYECTLRRSAISKMKFSHLSKWNDLYLLEVPLAKGGIKSRAIVSRELHDLLNSLRDSMRTNEHDYMWISTSNMNYGNRLSGSAIYEIVKRIGISADLPFSLTPHIIRNTGLVRGFSDVL